jgi:hypothetical protein
MQQVGGKPMFEILGTILILVAGAASAAIFIITAMDADFTTLWK